METIREILENVNKEIQSMVGGKMISAEDFHTTLQNIVDPIIEPKGMSYFLWEINLKGGGKVVAKLKITREEDKRSKYCKKWRTTSIGFEVGDEDILDLHYTELLNYFQKKDNQAWLDTIDMQIEEHRKKIKQLIAEKERLLRLE